MDSQDPRNRTHMRLQRLASRQPEVRPEYEVQPDVGGEPVNPFTAVSTDKPLVAVKGRRNGYLMLATRQEIQKYDEIPEDLLAAAWAWAITLEGLGAEKVYWMMLSEVNPHLHIHLFPRWPEDTVKGIQLFEGRDSAIQPAWTDAVNAALQEWAVQYQAELA